MIVAFDLDDTLYRELDYVESGFRAVADHLHEEHGIDPVVALDRMRTSVAVHGRGRAFDDVLMAHDIYTRSRRDRLVQVYRQHRPELTLPEESATVLDTLTDHGHRLFLVTDGNSWVQSRKIDALGIRDRFEHCYCTYRYGRAASKPATKVFELILRRTCSSPDNLVYVGDNPDKDFVGVRQMGGRTIRVLTGGHADVVPRPGHHADVDVESVVEVPDLVARWSSWADRSASPAAHPS